MNFEKPIKDSRRMSELITAPRLVPIVRHFGYFYNALVVVIVIMVIFLGMAKIMFGALFFNSCSLQPLLPVYLIVDSCFGLLVLWTIENKDKKVALRMQLALALILTVGLVFGTTLVIEVSQELYEAGHCGVSAPTAASLTTTPPDVNITVVATTLTCATCSIVLVKFTTAVVVIQWLIAVLAMFNGAVVIIQRYFSEDRGSDCCQTKGDNESKQPMCDS